MDLLLRTKELRECLRNSRNLLHDAETWTLHQELLHLYRQLLVDNLNFALDKKVEVDLWNVCFKDYISHLQTVSRNKTPLKKRQASEASVTLTWFLDMSSGYYLMLLQELQEKLDLDLPFRGRDNAILYTGRAPAVTASNLNKRNSLYICQHCLVHLGDLARYRGQNGQAGTFYRQAIQIAPGSGQAYNQLALLEASHGNLLGAAYFYVRSLALKYAFTASAANFSKLFARVDLEEETSKDLNELKITSQNYTKYVLNFLGKLHEVRQLKKAAKICHKLNEALTSLVAAEAFESKELCQIVAIALFMASDNMKVPTEEKSKDERLISALLSEFLAGMLNALLLPVYTLKQGELLLDYFALPAIKLILEWITLNPNMLRERGFLTRLQIWPSLCRTLNELVAVITEKKDLLQEDDSDIPLPEEYDLQAFLPLAPVLKRYNYRKAERCRLTGKEPPVTLLRAQRLVATGRTLAGQEFSEQSFITAKSLENQTVTFEACDHKWSLGNSEQFRDVISLEEMSDGDSDKSTHSLDKPDNEPTHPSASVTLERKGSKKVSQRKNVAMEAIMRQARLADDGQGYGNEVNTGFFSSPSPHNSQDSGSAFSQENAHPFSSERQTLVSHEKGVHSSFQLPDVTVPPPMGPHGGFLTELAMHSNKAPRPLQGEAMATPSTMATPAAIRGPQWSTHQSSSKDSFFGSSSTGQYSAFPPLNLDMPSSQPRPSIADGHSYALFPGVQSTSIPNSHWTRPPHASNSNGSLYCQMFQPGPSALEKLLQQNRKQ